MSSNQVVITWTTGVETIKRQTRAARVVVLLRLQARVCGLSLQPIGCTSALVCDVQRCISAVPFALFYLLTDVEAGTAAFAQHRWWHSSRSADAVQIPQPGGPVRRGFWDDERDRSDLWWQQHGRHQSGWPLRCHDDDLAPPTQARRIGHRGNLCIYAWMNMQ